MFGISTSASRYDRGRQFYLPEDIRYAQLALIFSSIPVAAFFYNDLLLFGMSDTFLALAALRASMLAFNAFIFVRLPRLKRYQSYDRVVFSWAMMGAAVNTLINSTRPTDFLMHVVTVIIFIFLVYLLVQFKRSYQVICGILFTVSEIALMLLNTQSVSTLDFFSAVFCLLLANLIGLVGSREFVYYRQKTLQAKEDIEASERRYREFADSLPEIVFEADSEARLTFLNRMAFQNLGYTEGEARGMAMTQFVAQEDRQRFSESYRRVISGGGNHDWLNGVEYSLIRKDGTMLPVMSFIERTKDLKGAPVIRGILVDISESKASNKRLEALNEKLSVVGRLTRHDVRNKLTVVVDNAYLAKEEARSIPGAVARIERIESAVGQIVQILDFSSTYEQVGSEAISCTDAGKFFDEAVSLHRDLQGVRAVNECRGVLVMADSLLRQVFYNLIDNSLKYGKTLTQVRLYHKPIPGGKLLVYEDDGVGLSAEDKVGLFTEGRGKGTGYGLFLIRKICTSYGWTITEEGEPGKGARFVMRTLCPDQPAPESPAPERARLDPQTRPDPT